MHDPHMFGIWSKYDWVIRLNPDVIVYHPDRLQRYMESPDVDAVLGSCSAPSTDPLDRRVMSDFVVFRPDRINLTTAVHRRNLSRRRLPWAPLSSSTTGPNGPPSHS